MRQYRTFGPAALAALAVLATGCGSAEHGSAVDSTKEPAAVAAKPSATESRGSDRAVRLPGKSIEHVIYVQFDNVHLTRDNPNVPSDVEQMPNLLDFLKDEGTLITHEHTPLIAHTADDILTSLTGVYPDHHGQAVANAFGYFTPTQTTKSFDGFGSSFAYWTDAVGTSTDTTFNMLTAGGLNAPAPWVPYTRAGFNFGAVSIANMEFENVTSDITTVFGAGSAAAAEAKSNRTKAIADYEGIAIHCAAGSTLCSADHGGAADVLPQEPGGYSGFNALFGHALVAPAISPNGPLLDLDGNPITDGKGNLGFPGFTYITASQSLGYVAAMQEHGVNVTFAYISDAHDDPATELADGPGEAAYVARLAAYNEAWGKFFTRLAADGITKDNTLFVITADEGDHFAGGTPSPANCDGVKVPCTYAKLGEIDANLTSLLDKQDPALAATPFDIHFDMAPTFYVEGNPAAGSPIARAYERATAQLTGTSVITGNVDTLTRYLVDPVGLKLLHMVTGDPMRTPTFVMFGDPDYYFQTTGTPDFVENPGFAWNHGGVDPKINRTFLGMVGPGVQQHGIDDLTWADHTDIRPTMLVLTGLTDDYAHDGRALIETLSERALPPSLTGDRGFAFVALATAYKQINAPVGELGQATLEISTRALAGDDATYARLEGELTTLTTARDDLASVILDKLEAAEFRGEALDFGSTFALVGQAEELLRRVRALKH
jgi:hypothetical protein